MTPIQALAPHLLDGGRLDRRWWPGRWWYVAAVAGFLCSFTGPAADALLDPSSTATSGRAVVTMVLCGLLLVGVVAALMQSLILDLLLTLAVRLTGRDAHLREAARYVDRSLPPLALGIAGAAVVVLVLGPQDAFASWVPSVTIAVAVIGHLGVLARLLGVGLDLSVRDQVTVLAGYVGVPALLLLGGGLTS